MKWYIFVIVALGLSLLAGCSSLFDIETDEIVGGARHYVDADAHKTIEST